MTYTIKKSDGTPLVDILDGTIDQTTDLNLIGKNATTFGQALNQDLVYLLENFSNAISPLKPLTGQLWYNTTNSSLQVYTGNTTGWRSTGAPIVQQDTPSNLVSGDIWINSRDQQLYFFDGSTLTLAGQTWTKSQGKTGFIAETLYDTNNNPNPVLQLWVNNSLFGMFSVINNFTPVPAIIGFTTLTKGYTASTAVSTIFNTTASYAKSLQIGDNPGTIVPASNFLRNDVNGSMSGQLSITNNGGLTIGDRSNVNFNLNGFSLQIDNTKENGNISIRTTDSFGIKSNIYINASSGHVGILTESPQQTLDVNGDARIRGDFEVDGKILTKPIALSIIGTETTSAITEKIRLILVDTASPSYYMNSQEAIVHYQKIDFSGSTITRYLKKYVITSGVWTFSADLTSSV
jgi:hypothetical protein